MGFVFFVWLSKVVFQWNAMDFKWVSWSFVYSDVSISWRFQWFYRGLLVALSLYTEWKKHASVFLATQLTGLLASLSLLQSLASTQGKMFEYC